MTSWSQIVDCMRFLFVGAFTSQAVDRKSTATLPMGQQFKFRAASRLLLGCISHCGNAANGMVTGKNGKTAGKVDIISKIR